MYIFHSVNYRNFQEVDQDMDPWNIGKHKKREGKHCNKEENIRVSKSCIKKILESRINPILLMKSLVQPRGLIKVERDEA